MKTSSRDTTGSPIAIDFGGGRIKIAYLDPDTKDVKRMRLGSHGEFFVPNYIGVKPNGNIVLGEEAERMINDPIESRWVRDNVKRDLLNLVTLNPRLRFGRRSEPLSHILEAVFSLLKTRVLQHQAFLGKEPEKVYVTYTLQYPSTIKKCFEDAAAKVFAAAEVSTMDEATAAAEMLRNVTDTSEDGKDDLILLDCGAGTIDCCFLRWAGTRYGIYSLEQMKQAYASISLGGIDIDNALVKLVKEKAGEAFNVRNVVSVRQQVRLAKHEYCLYGSGTTWSIQVNPETDVLIRPDEIQAAIRSEYLDKLCQPCETPVKEQSEHDKEHSEHEILSAHKILTDYIEGIKSGLSSGDRKPTLVLVGGCAKIEGLDEELQEAFDLQVSKITDLHRGDYATVLGPIYSYLKEHKAEDAASEPRQTPSGARTADPLAGPIQALEFSPNNRYLIAATGQCIQRWVIEENTTGVSLERKRTLEHTDTISALAFSLDSKLFAAATHTGDIRLWDAESNLPISDFKVKGSTITCLAFSPEGTHFAIGDAEHKVKLLHIHSGRASETFVGKKSKYRHKGAVKTLAFSPEGQMLASGAQDGVVTIWHVETEQKPGTTYVSPLHKVFGGTFLHKEHKYPVNHVRFVKYGRKGANWASLGSDGTLKFWVLTIEGNIVDCIFGDDLMYLISMNPETILDMLFDILYKYAGDKSVKHDGLNFRGMQSRFIKDGRLKIDSRVNDIPYTEKLTCIAVTIEIENRVLIALGSQEGNIQIWKGGEDLITLQ